MFHELGLDTELEHLYRLVVTRPHWRVPDLAEELCLSEGAVREQLDRLATEHLLGRSVAVQGGVRAVRPEVGLAQVLARREAELAARRDQLDSARRAVEELAASVSRSPGQQLDQVERVTGADAVVARAEEIVHRASGRVLRLVPVGSPREAGAAGSRMSEAASRRGVVVHTVLQLAGPDDLKTCHHRSSELSGLLARCRVSLTLPMGLLVVDDRTAVLPAAAPGAPDDVLVLHGPGLVTALVCLFEAVWERAIVIHPDGPDTSTHVRGGLRPQERVVLDLLAEGLTDDRVARRLGISVRSVRRVTADLFGRLDADSRFQAGIRAAQRGWFTPRSSGGEHGQHGPAAVEDDQAIA